MTVLFVMTIDKLVQNFLLVQSASYNKYLELILATSSFPW